MSGKPRRKAISKKTRFEIFKRDAFACQYCGAHPPGVMLHVDHIVAVAAGGGNALDNLVTACEPCNLGKGARDLKVAPQSLSDKAKLIAEREEQLLGYQAILESRRDRIDAERWRVAEEIETGSSEEGMDRDWLISIERFNERLGVHKSLEAARIARAKFPFYPKKTFLYFCGICWRWVREAEAANA